MCTNYPQRGLQPAGGDTVFDLFIQRHNPAY